MNVIKPPLTSDYTPIPLSILRGGKLSAKAVGILVWLLSHQDGYEICESKIIKAFTDGAKAIKSALAELQAAGYLTIKRNRIGSKPLYIINYEPKPQGNQTAGKPKAQNATSENRTYTSENGTCHTSDFGTYTSDFGTCHTSDFGTCPPYIEVNQNIEKFNKLTTSARPLDARVREYARARESIYAKKIEEEAEGKNAKDSGFQPGSQTVGGVEAAVSQEGDFSAAPNPNFPLSEAEEMEFFRQAIAYKLLGDRNLQRGNATAIASAAIKRLKKGCGTPDDKNLFGLYLEGALDENTRADETQAKIRERTMLKALEGL
jgi:hypothetical protein